MDIVRCIVYRLNDAHWKRYRSSQTIICIWIYVYNYNWLRSAEILTPRRVSVLANFPLNPLILVRAREKFCADSKSTLCNFIKTGKNSESVSSFVCIRLSMRSCAKFFNLALYLRFISFYRKQNVREKNVRKEKKKERKGKKVRQGKEELRKEWKRRERKENQGRQGMEGKKMAKRNEYPPLFLLISGFKQKRADACLETSLRTISIFHLLLISR